jgi:hypothetical protein
MSGRVKDSFKEGEFQEFLETAQASVNTEWEASLCRDLIEKFEQWGDTCYISVKQLAILEGIIRRGAR